MEGPSEVAEATIRRQHPPPAQPKPAKGRGGSTALTSPGSAADFLRGAKVGSAAGYVTVGSSVRCIPHRSRSAGSLSSTTSRASFSSTSEARDRFQQSPACHASAKSKPLGRYDPNAPRSRLAVQDFKVRSSNASSILFDHGLHVCHKRRFVTSHKASHVGLPVDIRSNPGIIAEATRWRRAQDAL